MVNYILMPLSIPASWAAAGCRNLAALGRTIFSLFSQTILENEEGILPPGLSDAEIENLQGDAYDPYALYLNENYFGVAYPSENRPKIIKSDYGSFETTDPYIITSINGIGVSEKKAKKYANYITEMTSKKVTAIYNPDLGAVRNVYRYYQEAFNEKITPAAVLLAKTWRNQLSENHKIIHIAHSEGCAITKMALTLLSAGEREKMYIIAVAPGAYIPKELCAEVQHYISPIDPVPLLDEKGRERSIEEETYNEINPIENYVSWILHRFLNRHYQDPIIKCCDKFKLLCNQSPASTS